MNHKKQRIKQFLIFSAIYLSQLSSAYSDQNELMGLSVEDLLNVEVISVAKKAKSLNDSPAAIFVISQDDIRRIGATSIPEALRLAPGLDVARIDTNTVVGNFGSEVINDYVSLDIHLAWRPVDGIELSLVGQNLLAGQHQEYRQESFTKPTEIDRGIYGQLTWRFGQ